MIPRCHKGVNSKVDRTLHEVVYRPKKHRILHYKLRSSLLSLFFSICIYVVHWTELHIKVYYMWQIALADPTFYVRGRGRLIYYCIIPPVVVQPRLIKYTDRVGNHIPSFVLIIRMGCLLIDCHECTRISIWSVLCIPSDLHFFFLRHFSHMGSIH